MRISSQNIVDFKKEMAPCYSKNGILKGTVDFYCLVCETYLRSEADNNGHIAKPIHKKNFDSTYYVKDFEEDFIRKIKKGYFCELCNKLLPMMARVKIHVKELAHIDSKNVMYFKRNGVYVIAFGKVVINDKAWNGLNEESCAFCNTEYEDEEIHKSQLSHTLNIIQIKVEVDENRNIYRKIDDVSFHCLTCNMVLALNNITHHFKEDQHKYLYQECCALSITNNDLKENETSTVIEDQSDKINDHLNIPLNNTGKNTEQEHTASNSDINIKCGVMEETTAIDARPLNEICEKEKESKNAANKELEDSKQNSTDCVPNSSNKTDENMEDSKDLQDNNKPTDKKVKKNKTKINPSELNNHKKTEISNEINKTTRSESSFNIEEYEKHICRMLKTENYITIDENGKTLCILCDWIMDPKTKKAHCSGLHHLTMEKMHKRRLADMGNKNKRNNIEEDTRDNIETENTEQEKSILDLVSKFQANNVNINLLFNTAVCKKCTVNLPYDVDAIEEHISTHNKTCKEDNKVTLQSREVKETCDNSSKEDNKVTLQSREVKETCDNSSKEDNKVTLQSREVKETCDNSSKEDNKVTLQSREVKETCENSSKEDNKVTLQSREVKETCENSSKVAIKENENEGNVRTENEVKLVTVEDKKEDEPPVKQAPANTDEKLINNGTASGTDEPSASVYLQKQGLANYIKILKAVKHMMFQDIIINEVICISYSSFNFFVSTKGVRKCLVCEEQVRDVHIHINTSKHLKSINSSQVILNERTEFVREIRPNLLHCGYCNMTESSWRDLQQHFTTSVHKENKDATGWRLTMYSTRARTDNNQETASRTSETALSNMFNGLY